MGAFDREADVIEIAVVQQLHMTHGALHQRFRRDAAVFLQHLLFQRAAVDAYANGDAPFTAGIRHGADALGCADVAGVDADLIHTLRGALQSQLIVKMDIRHQGDMDGRFDLTDGLGSLHSGHCHADDLAACRL